MSEDRKAVTPTRVIPAGEWPPVGPAGLLPPPPPPPPPVAVPEPQPEPDRRPLWPDPPTPGPIEVRVIFEPPLPVEEPDPTWRERLAAWGADLVRRVGPWRAVAALAGAMLPIPGVGYSAATTWAYCTGELREQAGVATGYVVAGGLLVLAVCKFRAAPSAPRLLLLVVSAFGVWGSLSWYDVIQGLTGVGR